MPGLGAILSNIGRPLAETVASNNFAQKAEDDKRRQDAMQAYAMQRQNSLDSGLRALQASTIGANNARASHLNTQDDIAEKDPVVQAIPSQDGRLYLRRKSGAVEEANIKGPASPNAPSGPTNPVPQASDSQDMIGDAAPGNNVGPVPGGPPTQQGPSAPPVAPPKFGKPPVAPKIDPYSPQAIKAKEDLQANAAKLRPAPQQPGVFVGNPDNPTAPAVYTPRDQAFGQSAPQHAAGGSASLAPDDRAKMVAQAKLDNETMKAYENKVMQSGKAPGFVAGAAGIAAGAAPAGIVGGLVGLAGNKATGAIDQDYQRYITAQRSYGRIMGNLQSKRYTDHQAEIERSISGLQGNDLNGTIQYKQQLRDASLADPAVQPSTGGGRGGGKPATITPKQSNDPGGSINLGASTRAQQLWDAAVAKHGREKVLAEFGPRPE